MNTFMGHERGASSAREDSWLCTYVQLAGEVAAYAGN